MAGKCISIKFFREWFTICKPEPKETPEKKSEPSRSESSYAKAPSKYEEIKPTPGRSTFY